MPRTNCATHPPCHAPTVPRTRRATHPPCHALDLLCHAPVVPRTNPRELASHRCRATPRATVPPPRSWWSSRCPRRTRRLRSTASRGSSGCARAATRAA
eukprot:4873883-Prymnesium_polylepis.1